MRITNKSDKNWDSYNLIIIIIIILSAIFLIIFRSDNSKIRPKLNDFYVSGNLVVRSSSSNNQLSSSQPTNPQINGSHASITVNNNYNPIPASTKPLQTNTNQLSQSPSDLQSGPNYNNPYIQSQIY